MGYKIKTKIEIHLNTYMILNEFDVIKTKIKIKLFYLYKALHATLRAL